MPSWSSNPWPAPTALTAAYEAVSYFRPLADRDSDEFFADSRYGEFWVGARPSIADIELELGRILKAL